MDALKGLPAHFNILPETKLGNSDIDYLLLNTPPVCNYDCEKCFTSATRKSPKNYLTTREIKDLIDKSCEKGVRCIGILGEGEPLLFIDKMTKEVNYREIIKHANKKGLITLISTNASLLTKDIVDFFYENNVSIAISLDTLNDIEYKVFYRGAADLNKVLDNLAYARSVYINDIEEINKIKIKRLCIHMTVTSKNYNNLPQIIELCGDDIYFDCEHIAPIGIANENPSVYKEYKSCVEACNNAGKAMVRTFVPELNGDSCCFFYYGFAVAHDGEVLVDTHALDTKNKIGNIREHPFGYLINRARVLRDKYFREYDCHYCIIRSTNYSKYLDDQIQINVFK
ncbi:radical SAM protein [Vibrio mimicus]